MLLKTVVLLGGTGLKGAFIMGTPAGYEAVAQEEMMAAALPLSPEELYVTVTTTAPQALLGLWTAVLTTGMSATTLRSPPGQRSLGHLQHGQMFQQSLEMFNRGNPKLPELAHRAFKCYAIIERLYLLNKDLMSFSVKRLSALAVPCHYLGSFWLRAIMKVYEDFFLYKGGIYRHSQQAGSKWKTHSVKLLGLPQIPGEDPGEKMVILGFYVDKMSVILKS
ncbi:hypothetical protein TURU_089218 [Turdus rufiventris]|nr:hypothetical protein TURU_089218 [Turdus rufiventris]